MRIAVIGSVESSRTALQALAAVRDLAEVAAVVTLPLELQARHSDFVDLAPEAALLGARLIRAADANAPEVVADLEALDLDHLLVVGWSQICREPLCAAARRGAIGYHPAPLPRLRGRAAIPWTILLDEKITAGSLFWLAPGVDAGPILLQRFFHVAPDETAASLYAGHMRALDRLVREAVPLLAGRQPPREPQDERHATWAAKRTPADGRIDWTQPAQAVWRLVRAVGRPYPGAFTLWQGRRLILWQAAPWPQGGARHAALPGQVIARDAAGFAVRCGDGQDLWVEAFAWAEAGSEAPPRLHARLGEG